MKKYFVVSTLVLLTSLAVHAKSVAVSVVLNPMGDFVAKTSDIRGSVQVQGDTLVAKNVVVNLKTLKTGVELRDKHTLKHLNVAQHPEAILSIGKGKAGKGQGKIKINGIEKVIKGTYQVAGGQVKAKFSLKLSDFNIKDINYMGVGVEDEVTINVTLPVGG